MTRFDLAIHQEKMNKTKKSLVVPSYAFQLFLRYAVEVRSLVNS